MQQMGKLRPGGVWGPSHGPAEGLPKTGRGGSGLGDSLCPHPVPLLETLRLELEARLDTAQCYANPGKGAWGGDTPSSRKPCPKPWVGGGAPQRNWGLGPAYLCGGELCRGFSGPGPVSALL